MKILNTERFKILLVEDELIIAISQKKELEKLGYEVSVSKNGANAIQEIIENNSAFDIILMDINLGQGIDGIQTAVEINKLKEIPIIFLSSNTDTDTLERAQKTNPYGYIAKQTGIVFLDFTIKAAIRLFRERLTNRQTINDNQNTAELYKVFVNIATLYLKKSSKILDEKINESLALIGQFVGADRTYIFDYDFERMVTHNTYEWCKEGITPEITNLQNLEIEFIHNWVISHISGKPMIVENVDDLNDEDNLKAILAPQGIKSLITVPVFKDEKCYGFIGIDYVRNYKIITSVEFEILTKYTEILNGLYSRKEYEKLLEKQILEKNSLLNEVHHRVKNNNSIIISLLKLQIDSTNNDTIKLELQNVLSRILSINELYSSLIFSNKDLKISLKNYIEGLINIFKSAFSTHGKFDITISIDEITMLSSLVISIGIILNELLTNIYKYAFKADGNGSVEITIKQKGENLSLLVKDNGIGIDEKFLNEKNYGFGMTTIKMLVEDQLAGNYKTLRKNGTITEINFRLTEN